jgi:hypothetical protein
VNLDELHAAVTAALVDVDPDMAVLTPVDALEPPAFIVQAGRDPWLSIRTVGADVAEVEVVAVQARLTPEANYPALLAMVDQAADALAAAALRPYEALRPAPFEIGGVTYLAARLEIRQPVTRNTPGGTRHA